MLIRLGFYKFVCTWTRYPQRQLSENSNQPFILYREISETYDELWQRIKAQNPDDAELATRVIHWVFYAVEPLTLPEIQHALAVEPGDTFLDDDNITSEDHLVSVCAGIVHVQREGGEVGLVHYTAQEYLERKAAQHFPSAQKEILRNCLTYLLLDEFSSGRCRTTKEVRARCQKYPFLDYAANNWGVHARGELEESKEEWVWKFLNQYPNLSFSVQITYEYDEPENFPRNAFALSVASLFGLCRIVRALLKEGPDVTVKGIFRRTPLELAAAQGHDEVVRLLLEYKADQFKEFALHQATLYGNEEVVRVLLQYSTDINALETDG